MSATTRSSIQAWTMNAEYTTPGSLCRKIRLNGSNAAVIVMRNLGDMPAGAIRDAELVHGHAITDSLRLASLTVAVFPREQSIDGDAVIPSGPSAAFPQTT
jgi:hypothetical protein